MNKKVLLSVSGGIDSSVSIYLLKKMGYIVEGVFVKNWNSKNNECNYMEDFLDAKSVTKKFKIKLYTLNTSKIYKEKVFKKFLLEYKIGNTPNPDILCNKYVKFNELIKFSKKINANYISTGHYVKLINFKNKYFLSKPLDKYNDQSYFLYTLKNDILKRCIFPMNDILKIDVRKIAKKLNLINHNKPSSKGICYINNKSFKKFIKKFIKDKNGYIYTDTGYKIGKHNGLHFYTIGQRKGICIGGKKEFNSNPWYVTKKDIKNNILYITQNNKKNFLFKGLIATKINWINYKPKLKKLKLSVKIRYSINTISSTLYVINNNKVLVIFDKYNGIVILGQSVVFYINNFCIGGGIIFKEIY